MRIVRAALLGVLTAAAIAVAGTYNGFLPPAALVGTKNVGATTSAPEGRTASAAREAGTLADRISALRQLPAIPAPERAAVRPALEQLGEPGATVDIASAREAAAGIYIARRSDGLPCIKTSKFGGCVHAAPGGVLLVPSAVRVRDSADAPWQLTIAGLAVDGISTVSIVLADGSRLPASVRNNVFQVQLEGGYDSTAVKGYVINGKFHSLS